MEESIERRLSDIEQSIAELSQQMYKLQKMFEPGGVIHALLAEQNTQERLYPLFTSWSKELILDIEKHVRSSINRLNAPITTPKSSELHRVNSANVSTNQTGARANASSDIPCKGVPPLTALNFDVEPFSKREPQPKFASHSTLAEVARRENDSSLEQSHVDLMDCAKAAELETVESHNDPLMHPSSPEPPMKKQCIDCDHLPECKSSEYTSNDQDSSSSASEKPTEGVPNYIMSRSIRTIPQLWQEWKQGLDGGPSVEYLEQTYSSRWRSHVSERKFFQRRKIILQRIIELSHEKKMSQDQVVAALEHYRCNQGKTLNWMSCHIHELSQIPDAYFQK